MKYQNLPAFEKHLEQASKLHLSRVFLVVIACPYERRKIIEKIVTAIRSRECAVDLQVEEANLGSLEGQMNGLNTTTLFSGKQVLYLDGIDKLKKNGLAPLITYIERPSPFAYLLLGASSSKSLVDLYSKGKKELIVCDLTDEKPWDRKERLKRYLISEVAKVGKKLNAEAVEYLLENVGLNLPGLEQEIIKLITYVAERSELTLQDVHLLCPTQKSSTVWQLAEAIVWKQSLPRPEEIADLSMLLPLISQLRSQLQQGLILSVLVDRGAAHAEITHHLPTLKPAALDKMLPIVKSRRTPFFKRALDFLFDVELMAKNSSLDPGLILDVFTTKMALLSRSVKKSLN